MALAFWRSDTIGYTDLAARLSQQAKVTTSPQSIASKLKKGEKFFESVARQAICWSKVFSPSFDFCLPGVKNIFLADSSTIVLNQALSQVLVATTDGAAALKVNAVFNLTQQSVAQISLAAGKESEHAFKDLHSQVLRPGDLMIRDLGYFDHEHLHQLAQEGTYYLTRIPLSVKSFANEDGLSFNIWQFLASSRNHEHEFLFAMGSSTTLSRVVAKRLPKTKGKERVTALRKTKGRPLTSVEKATAKWNLMTTNLTKEQASLDTLCRLYALRWQIELFFKAIKSSLGIDKLKLVSCAAIAKSYIWARLTYAVVMLSIRGFAQHELSEEIGIIKWFRRLETFLPEMRSFIQKGRWLALAKLIKKISIEWCKPQKRFRKTSWEKFNHTKDAEAFV